MTKKKKRKKKKTDDRPMTSTVNGPNILKAN